MRRVVTGWDASNNPVVLLDDAPPEVVNIERARAWEVWIADDTPPDLRSMEDTTRRAWSLEPPAPRGSAFRIIEFRAHGRSDMHSTDTLDYGVVLSGAITLKSLDSETILEAGDTFVQRGAPHEWFNHTDESCFVALVLIKAAPR